MERALSAKDSTCDGAFFVAVKTTGIFCRPSCSSRPKRENVEFFGSANECLNAGYRPCKRCHPTASGGFASHSRLREAFAHAFDAAPRQSRLGAKRIVTALLESPLGPLLAAADDDGLRVLDFTDQEPVEQKSENLRRQFDPPMVFGEHEVIAQLRHELGEYFSAKRWDFRVRLAPRGTPFQEKVWQELRRIPHGETISYAELAQRTGRPTAQRAVASANRLNRICILIPCHRVIGKDGSLTGYGGGLWRKRLLLELEGSGHLPRSHSQLNLLNATTERNAN
ncbi:MAG: methylated-DNA--[protein]-cysteine S-methyltransferase [Verrucomicrobia bacterium]|nr:methylated-DNA--[protein]-cysteine S-methyltransferase [Verrucomicrobiota bacterium]